MVVTRHLVRLLLATVIAVIGLLAAFVLAPAQDSSGVLSQTDAAWSQVVTPSRI